MGNVMNLRNVFQHLLLGLGFSLVSIGVVAATFNQFSPATGVLKGNASTYVTTAAVSADIRGLWTGSCDATTFLRGDGACAVVAVPSAANPTASIGLSAVNGVATTFMRSDAAPALSQSITPTWSGAHTFTSSGTGGIPATVTYSAQIPQWNLLETDGPANENYWGFFANGGQLTFRTINDAGSVTADWLTVVRTGVAVDNVTIGNAVNNPTYTFPSSGATTWAGPHTFSVVGSDVTPSVSLASSLPIFSLKNTASAANEKQWEMNAIGNGFFLYTIDDAGSNARTLLHAARSGSNITNIQIGGSTDNPTYTFPSTGTASFTGDVTVGGSSVCREDGTNCPGGGGGSIVYGAFMQPNGTIVGKTWTGVENDPPPMDPFYTITTDIPDTGQQCYAVASAVGTGGLPPGVVSVGISTTGGFISMINVIFNSAGAQIEDGTWILLTCDP